MMLSKLKATVAETATLASHHETQSIASEMSDEDTTVDVPEQNNDSNNNNNNNNNIDNVNNNNINHQGSQSSKKKQQQGQLLDIIEVSRKRRLSKDSADSLTSFIRWSFSHIEPCQLASRSAEGSIEDDDDEDKKSPRIELELDDDDVVDDEDQVDDIGEDGWRSISDPLTSAKRQARLASQTEPTDLALIRTNHHSSDSPNKRAKTSYLPESNNSSTNNNNNNSGTNSFLGNVVDRLHKQQQQQAHSQLGRLTRNQLQSDDTSDLSYNLQQYLRQQPALDMSTDSAAATNQLSHHNQADSDNNQLALAAAIHRALLDSVSQQGAGVDCKLNLAPPAAAPSPLGAASANHLASVFHNTSNLNPLAAAGLQTNAGLNLVDNLNRQRRMLQTRAALNGLANSRLQQQQQQSSAAAAAAAMTMTHRLQQQRHAQAAAALSAMARAGAHPSIRHHLAAAAAATGVVGGATGLGGPATPSNPMVEFKCDVCLSSFDDRHRLMQHQSIHLELKKDWYCVTPVDEVMKIFNRRRGEFLCNICNLRFEATLDYDQHNHAVHGPKPYCCQFCGNGTRTFKNWRQYLNHLYDHRFVFSCTIEDCDFTVNRKDSLRFHIFRFHLNCQLPQDQLQQFRLNLQNGQNLSLTTGSGDDEPPRHWPLDGGADSDEDNLD